MSTNVRDRRQWAIIGSLVFATAVCALLYALRALYARSLVHSGLVWNLFLAWLPMLSSLAAYNLALRGRRSIGFVILGCALLWLLFFPNAPYILTDVGNLRPRYPVPMWYDVLMFVAFAWTGTLLGLVSLYLMQTLVRRARGQAASWLFALVVLVLGSFGVYLGRFHRFNSWDVFTNPLDVLGGIFAGLLDPAANPQMFVFSGLFALLLVSVYLVFVSVVHFQTAET